MKRKHPLDAWEESMIDDPEPHIEPLPYSGPIQLAAVVSSALVVIALGLVVL
jgi:hypothetical protein